MNETAEQVETLLGDRGRVVKRGKRFVDVEWLPGDDMRGGDTGPITYRINSWGSWCYPCAPCEATNGRRWWQHGFPKGLSLMEQHEIVTALAVDSEWTGARDGVRYRFK